MPTPPFTASSVDKNGADLAREKQAIMTIAASIRVGNGKLIMEILQWVALFFKLFDLLFKIVFFDGFRFRSTHPTLARSKNFMTTGLTLSSVGDDKYIAKCKNGLTYTIKFKHGLSYIDDPCFVATGGKGREVVAQTKAFQNAHAIGTQLYAGTNIAKFRGLFGYHEVTPQLIEC